MLSPFLPKHFDSTRPIATDAKSKVTGNNLELKKEFSSEVTLLLDWLDLLLPIYDDFLTERFLSSIKPSPSAFC